MSSFQKVVKYFAITLAIIIIVNIVLVTYSIVSNFYQRNDDKLETINLNQNINSLEIDLKATKLTIKTGDSFMIETNSKDIDCNEFNNKLSLIEKNNFNLFGISKNIELILYIPENMVFDDVEIEVSAGTVDIDEISTRLLSLELGAGKFSISNLNVSEKTKIKSGVGSTTIRKANLKNLELNSGVGELELNASLNGYSKIDAGVGKLNINLLDSIDNYTIQVDKGIGSVKLNDSKISEKIGNGINQIKIDGGVGSINITTR